MVGQLGRRWLQDRKRCFQASIIHLIPTTDKPRSRRKQSEFGWRKGRKGRPNSERLPVAITITARSSIGRHAKTSASKKPSPLALEKGSLLALITKNRASAFF